MKISKKYHIRKKGRGKGRLRRNPQLYKTLVPFSFNGKPVEVGDIYRRNYDGQEYIVFMVGKPTVNGQFRNHLLVKRGKNGNMLTFNGQNTQGANYEHFHERYTYVGKYNSVDTDFKLGRFSHASGGILVGELTGPKLKRDLNLKRVVKRWHNRNKTGGNFGINLYTHDKPRNLDSPIQGIVAKDYELTGYHNNEEVVTSLSIGPLYGSGVQIFPRGSQSYQEWDYARLIRLVKRVISSPHGAWEVGRDE